MYYVEILEENNIIDDNYTIPINTKVSTEDKNYSDNYFYNKTYLSRELPSNSCDVDDYITNDNYESSKKEISSSNNNNNNDRKNKDNVDLRQVNVAKVMNYKRCEPRTRVSTRKYKLYNETKMPRYSKQKR